MSEQDKVYLCYSCNNGRPECCSGYCGIVAPTVKFGPMTKQEEKEFSDLVSELKELGVEID